MSEIRVQPRSVYEHHIVTKKAHVTLNWKFSTKKNSICFGLYYHPDTLPNSARTSIDETPRRIKRRTLSLPKLRRTIDIPANKDFASDQDDSPPMHSTKKKRKPSFEASVNHLLDNNFIEKIPMKQVNSSKEAIVGSFLAEEPGNYVFIFGTSRAEEISTFWSYSTKLFVDNMFSRNTSKTLILTVTTNEPIIDDTATRDSSDYISGWLLKKRRKRMQGKL